MFPRPILMNEEGSSPGGGAPPTADAPAANQGAPALPSVADIQTAVAQQLADFKNGFFADLRKAGALPKPDSKPSPTSPVAAPTPLEAPGAPSAATGMTATEVQTLMSRERAFTRATATAGLTPDQESIVEQAYRAMNPPDPYEWATTFIKVMGLGQKPPTAPATPTQAPPAPAAQNTPTVPPGFFDKGPAATSAARDPMAILQNDPRKGTMDDYRRLVAQHGATKAGQIWTDNVMAFLQTVRVRPDGRR